jgi:hypothetical protein
MSAWYSLSGTVRVRNSQEVDEILAKIRSHCGCAFEVELVPVDAGTSEFSIEGGGLFSAGGVLVLDDLIESLGPHALEAAVLTVAYENEPYELVVAPTADAAVLALSRYRLEQIKPLLNNLTTEDRESLVTLLRQANG